VWREATYVAIIRQGRGQVASVALQANSGFGRISKGQLAHMTLPSDDASEHEQDPTHGPDRAKCGMRSTELHHCPKFFVVRTVDTLL